MRCWHCGHMIQARSRKKEPPPTNCPGCGASLGRAAGGLNSAPPPPDTSAPRPTDAPGIAPPVWRRNPASHGLSLGQVMLLLLALASFAGGAYLGWQSYQLSSTLERAQGRVIRKEPLEKDKSKGWLGTVAFVAANGHTYQVELAGAGTLKIGDAVEVLYQRDAPNNARTDAGVGLWKYPLACGGLGCVFMMVWLFTLAKGSEAGPIATAPKLACQ